MIKILERTTTNQITMNTIRKILTYVLRSFNKRQFSNKKEGHILDSHPTQDSSHHQDYYISRFQKFPNLNLHLPHCYIHNPKIHRSTSSPGCFPSVVPPSVVWALHLIESIHGIWIHWCRDHREGHRTVEGHLVRVTMDFKNEQHQCWNTKELKTLEKGVFFTVFLVKQLAPGTLPGCFSASCLPYLWLGYRRCVTWASSKLGSHLNLWNSKTSQVPKNLEFCVDEIWQMNQQKSKNLALDIWLLWDILHRPLNCQHSLYQWPPRFGQGSAISLVMKWLISSKKISGLQ